MALLVIRCRVRWLCNGRAGAQAPGYTEAAGPPRSVAVTSTRDKQPRERRPRAHSTADKGQSRRPRCLPATLSRAPASAAPSGLAGHILRSATAACHKQQTARLRSFSCASIPSPGSLPQGLAAATSHPGQLGRAAPCGSCLLCGAPLIQRAVTPAAANEQGSSGRQLREGSLVWRLLA